MPLVFACVAPHGEPVIPALASSSSRGKYAETTRAMRRLAREIRAFRPQTIVVATPHNLRLRGHIAVVTAENASGTLPMFGRGPARLRIRAKCDVAFAESLLAVAEKRRLPVVGANYATTVGRFSNMPLDWGTLVPLWFFMKGHRVRPKLVVVTPSREIPLGENVRFGTMVADSAEKVKQRIVFVASADHAHAHRTSGPYGFSRAAAKYDRDVVEAIRANTLPSLLQLSARLVRDAKPDSLWQLAILTGVVERLRMQSALYSYQVPTYYGMICAAFRR